jgi:hypothetical protein
MDDMAERFDEATRVTVARRVHRPVGAQAQPDRT